MKKFFTILLLLVMTLPTFEMGLFAEDLSTLFTAAEASKVWGEPAIKKASSPLTVTFVPMSDSAKLELHIYSRSLKGMMTSLQAATNFKAQAAGARGAGAKFFAADVVGDASFWNAEFRQLAVFIKGHVLLITATSSDEVKARAFAQAAAQIIVAKL